MSSVITLPKADALPPHELVSPRHCAACLTAYRLQTVEIMRSCEMSCRACGMYEHANAVRQYADDLEGFARGDGHLTDLVWDSGVFDRHGPPGEGEMPHLVESSPRLQTCATCPAPVHYELGKGRDGRALMLTRGRKYVCKPCFDAGGAQ